MIFLQFIPTARQQHYILNRKLQQKHWIEIVRLSH